MGMLYEFSEEDKIRLGLIPVKDVNDDREPLFDIDIEKLEEKENE